MLRSKAVRSFVLISLVALGSRAGWGQNLLTNPRFDAGISGWTNASVAHPVAFNPSGDADGDPPGSLVAAVTIQGGVLNTSLCSAASQCVPVTTGGQYVASGLTFVHHFSTISTPLNPRTVVSVGFFDGASCAGNLLGAPVFAAPSNNGSTPDAWLSTTTPLLTAPPAALSAFFGVTACVANMPAETIGILVAEFDNLYFGPLPGPIEVPALGGAGLAALAVVLFALGLALLRRRAAG